MARAPLILIVSEHEWASRSLDTVLAPRGYAVLRAYNGQQAFERAAGSRPDAVFVDRSLPDMSGLEVCRDLYERELITRSTPAMLVTAGAATRDERLEALKAGAWELLTLPFDAEELLLRMDRYIRAKLETDRAREEALLDSATGLYSSEGIARRLRELAAAAERFGRPIACVVYSPASDPGDDPDAEADPAGLSRLAELLRGATRRSDVLGRIGPREFAVVAPDTSPEGARILAERLRHTGGSGNGNGNGDGNGGDGDKDGPAAPLGRAGVCAISDLRAAGIDPLDLLRRASTASREDALELN